MFFFVVWGMELDGGGGGGFSESESMSEEEAWDWKDVLSGVSMRKETDSRISASVAGFLVFVLRAAGGGRFAASGRDSWRGRFLFVLVFSVFAGWVCESATSCVLSSSCLSSGLSNMSHPIPRSSSSSLSSTALRKASSLDLRQSCLASRQ